MNRELHFVDRERNREYQIADGELPFFMHRERGLHLDEPDVTVDGAPVTAAHPRHRADALLRRAAPRPSRGQGIYFYLPKLEARRRGALVPRPLRREPRARCRSCETRRSAPSRSSSRCPCVYQMEEMLHALGPYAAGLNAARWDLKARIFEFVMADPDVGVAGPLRRGHQDHAVPRRTSSGGWSRSASSTAPCPIGGMATALPNPDPEVNRVAARVDPQADKEWEAEQGFIRAWVAHIFHMKTAADPFKQLHRLGLEADARRWPNPDNYPVAHRGAGGPDHASRARAATRAWSSSTSRAGCNGRGAKGIDSLAGKPGVHPALMEDLATGRMSVAQIAQRIRHARADHRGPGRDPRRRAGEAAAPGGAATTSCA